MIKRYFIFLIITFFFLSLEVQAQYRFEVVMNEPGIDNPRSVKQTPDSGYIVCGTSNSYNSNSDMDAYLVKFKPDGSVDWKKNYGSLYIENTKSVLITADSGFVLSGFTNRSGGTYSPYIIRTDAYGNMLWESIYGGIDWEFINTSVMLANGSMLFAGYTYRLSSGGPGGFIMKTDANGNILWKKVYSGTDHDEFKSINSCSNGDIIACGITNSWGAGGSDIWIYRMNSNGDSIWSKTIGGPLDDFSYSIQETQNGDLICGGSFQTADSVLQCYIIRTDFSGNELFHFMDSRPSDQEFHSVHETSDGRLVAAGYTANNTGGREDYFLFRLNADCSFVWARTYGSLETEVCYDMQVCSDDGFVMAGETNSYGSNFPNLYIIKTDSSGVSSGSVVLGIRTHNTILSDILIFPNPTNKDFRIRYDQALFPNGEGTIEVVSVNGQIMRTFPITGQGLTADIYIGDITEGFYWVILRSNHVIARKPICIQR